MEKTAFRGSILGGIQHFGDNESQLAEYAWFTSGPKQEPSPNAVWWECVFHIMPDNPHGKSFSDFGNQKYPQAYPR